MTVMLISDFGIDYSPLRLPLPLPQLTSTPASTGTISLHSDNLPELPNQYGSTPLLNTARSSNPVQITADSLTSIHHHGHPPTATAATNHDSPLVSSLPHVSTSLAPNNIRLRTTPSTYRPLPAVLPPVPSLSSYNTTSIPISSLSSLRVPVKKSSVSTLRSNYTKMLAKKSRMLPPPAVTRTTSTQSESHMDLFMDLGINTQSAATDQPPAVHDSSTLGSVTNSGGVEPGGEATGGFFGVTSASAADAGTNTSMTMEDLLEFLNTPPTPSLHQPPTPLSQSSSQTSPLLFDNDEYNKYLYTPLTDPIGFSPSVVSQTSPYQTSPLQLLEDLYADLSSLKDQPLFFDASMTVSSSSAPNSLPCNNAVATGSKPSTTVNPSTLGLSRANSWGSAPPSSASFSAGSISPTVPTTILRPIHTLGNASPPRLSDSPTSASASASASTVPLPNGIRKNVKPGDLLPVDAPIQARNYITPSATSRREVPPSVARTFVPSSSARKRSATAAGLAAAEDMQDELAEEETDEMIAQRNKERESMDPEKRALLEHVEASRKRNTLAARKSRARKLEHVRGLEELVERLQAENEALRSRVDVCEGRLRDAGLDAS
ncbi:hypothetical protein FRB96_003560 [Tulasnella sp. 330]|nr:hypothetical protein FRB96_003560 [Tulasnella sp. 330]KAG8886261.1 hypothetical protein FRB97_006265 [Tulasnella sp. 331]